MSIYFENITVTVPFVQTLGNDIVTLATKLEVVSMRLIMYNQYAKFHLILAHNN
jgi:hypothetical protein